MAFRFNGTDQKLSASTAVVAAAPMTLAAWFNPDTTTHPDFLITVGKFNNGAGNEGEFYCVSARGDQTGDLVWAAAFNGTDAGHAQSASPFSTGVWQHMGAVFASTASRTAYLNAVPGTTGTTPTVSAVNVMDRTTIGGIQRSDNPAVNADGDLAEAAIWNAALTTEEMNALAKGFAAWPFVRPNNLVTYVPMNRSVRDYMQGASFTAENSPTQLEHPVKILRPRPLVMRSVASAAGGILTSLISYWKLDEASGDALDSHGANQLTDNNTVGSATGKINGGRDFEDTNSEFFSIASNSTLQTGNIDYTFQAWVKLEGYGGAFTNILTKTSAFANAGREYALFHNQAGGFSFQVYANLTSGGGSLANSPVIATLGEWYCIHCWQDNSNGLVGISVNAGTPVTGALGVVPYVGTNPFFIGKQFTTGVNYFDGIIDEVGFWKRVLTSDERTALYNAGAGLAYPFSVSAVFRPAWAIGANATHIGLS